MGVRVARLSLRDFRSYESLDLELPAGLTVVTGPNGEGKTNLVEAIGFLATLDSLRGSPNEAMVRVGCSAAIIRADLESDEAPGSSKHLEIDIPLKGKVRVILNRKPLARNRDLLGHFRATVFTPDDLVLVKGPASGRRKMLDEALSTIDRRLDSMRVEVDRILRQRNALLRQVSGRPDEAALATLDVWDEKLSVSGAAYSDERERLVDDLRPHVEESMSRIAPLEPGVGLTYQRGWQGDLISCLAASRKEDLRRGVTNVGPHRDEVEILLGGMTARSQASQGEQRTIALALRLALHSVIIQRTGIEPVLLLDDVFSELDPVRSAALVSALPGGQAILTTADIEPPGLTPVLRLRVSNGSVERWG